MTENKMARIDPPLKRTEGIKDEVAVKIFKMLQKGRRYFGSAGAGMTRQAFSPEFREKEGLKPEKAKEYLEAERSTSVMLKKWVADKPHAVLIDSVRVPDWDEEPRLNEEVGIFYEGDTDHVIVIGDDVILIDTQSWTKKKTYTIGDDGQALMTNKPFPNGEMLMSETLEKWLDYLDEDASLTGIVCVNNEEVTVIRNKNWYTQNNYRLVEIDRFEELLNDKWKSIEEEKEESDTDEDHINSTLVSQIVVKCIKPYDEYSKVFSNAQALKDFR